MCTNINMNIHEHISLVAYAGKTAGSQSCHPPLPKPANDTVVFLLWYWFIFMSLLKWIVGVGGIYNFVHTHRYIYRYVHHFLDAQLRRKYCLKCETSDVELLD